jgi:hypothetical protein
VEKDWCGQDKMRSGRLPASDGGYGDDYGAEYLDCCTTDNLNAAAACDSDCELSDGNREDDKRGERTNTEAATGHITNIERRLYREAWLRDVAMLFFCQKMQKP